MNKDHVMVVANTLKKCILNGDIDLWMELLNIPDDISSQSLNKWFNDYFVVCRVQNCEIDICKPFHMRGIPFQGEFICSIKVEYAGYDDFATAFKIRIKRDEKDYRYKIINMEQLFDVGESHNISWKSNLKEKSPWWKSSLVTFVSNQKSQLSYKQLSRAVTRNVRFRTAHIQLECASILTCMTSCVISDISRQLDIEHKASEEKVKEIYDVMREKFCLQVERLDRDNTWASKFIAPGYGIEEILVGSGNQEKIAVSCNLFMTIFYSFLRWCGFSTSQIVQFRIVNQDYLIVCSDNDNLFFISHDRITKCTSGTIYPNGKIERVFGADWFIDFKCNEIEISKSQMIEYNKIAKRCILPKCPYCSSESVSYLIDAKNANELRNSIFRTNDLVCNSIFLWAKYTSQSLYVDKPEAYIYWSVKSNWGKVTFESEKEIYEYMKKLQRKSIYIEDDRIMTADQCIRYQMGRDKDLAIFLYAAIKKYLSLFGYIVYTDKYQYCVYYHRGENEWVIYNVSCFRKEKHLVGMVLLVFNESESYYPLQKKQYFDIVQKYSEKYSRQHSADKQFG